MKTTSNMMLCQRLHKNIHLDLWTLKIIQFIQFRSFKFQKITFVQIFICVISWSLVREMGRRGVARFRWWGKVIRESHHSSHFRPLKWIFLVSWDRFDDGVLDIIIKPDPGVNPAKGQGLEFHGSTRKN